ncbi:hypothetical protein GF345_02810 [Candidatus Woesearchaeota archaeon]|nr:hypothetical protein [Candidatus Woesearchaeota archaeon]
MKQKIKKLAGIVGFLVMVLTLSSIAHAATYECRNTEDHTYIVLEQGELITLMTTDGYQHEIELVDVSDDERMCGLSIDGDVIWTSVGATPPEVNNVYVWVDSADIVSQEVQDNDTCDVHVMCRWRCDAGESYCANSRVYECNSDGMFEIVETCSEGCEGDSCKSEAYDPVCHDSDGGEDPFEKGYTKGHWLCLDDGKPIVTETDYCVDDDTVMEFLCNAPNGCNNILAREIGCEFGCENGKCLPEPSEIEFDLAYYPQLFTDNGEIDVTLVVGDEAPAEDVVSAVDIGASLNFAGYSGNAAAKLASEMMGNLERINTILVGNPCNNEATQDMLGLDRFNVCPQVIDKGEAVIALFDRYGETQLIVAGHSDADTRRAAYVLANYDDYDLKGKIMTVKGTSFSDIMILYGGNIDIPDHEQEDDLEDEDEKDYGLTDQDDEPENNSDDEEPQEMVESGSVADEKCKGCKKEGSCLDYGLRIVDDAGTPVYCDLDNSFKEQKQENSQCQNNYECQTNQCSSGKCIDLEKELKETRGLLDELFELLRSIFR